MLALFLLFVTVVAFSSIRSLPFSTLTQDWQDKGYSDELILRYPKDGRIDVLVVYLYSSSFFLDYFPDLPLLCTSFLETTEDETGLSIPQFYQKYINYQWQFTFYKEQISYTANIPHYAPTIYPELDEVYYDNAEATQKALEVWDSWRAKNVNLLKAADAIIYLSDFYFRGVVLGTTSLSMWWDFGPTQWERVDNWMGGNETRAKASLKFCFAHEICHGFGSLDHYHYGGGLNVRFYTDCIMGDGGWGSSTKTDEAPYIDGRILEQEIHWSYLIKEKLYPVPITISGTVEDHRGDELRNAKIYFNDQIKTETDATGFFSFVLFDGGEGKILFQKHGYSDSDGGWPNGRSWWQDTEVKVVMYEEFEVDNGEQKQDGQELPWQLLLMILGVVLIITALILARVKG